MSQFISLGLRLAITGQIISNVLAEDSFIKWGPSVNFEHGDYWGQSALDATTGTQVPHGTGTYISRQGHLLYAGKWWRGYMHGRGNRYFAVSCPTRIPKCSNEVS